MQAIEETLRMPPMIISAYIESGDETLLDRIAYKSADQATRPTPEYTSGDNGQLINSVRELLHIHGVDKVTAAVIAAVREYDEEVRKQAQRPQTHGDIPRQFE